MTKFQPFYIQFQNVVLGPTNIYALQCNTVSDHVHQEFDI